MTKDEIKVLKMCITRRTSTIFPCYCAESNDDINVDIYAICGFIKIAGIRWVADSRVVRYAAIVLIIRVVY